MASMPKGILGGFTGTIGPTVGAIWRGKDYVRRRSPRRKAGSSPKQLEQQLKFAVVTRFQQPLRGLLNQTFPYYKKDTTGANRALGFNLREAVCGTYPDYTINYSRFLISKGGLPNPEMSTATAGGDGLVNFSWTKHAKWGRTDLNDRAVLVVYCPEMRQCVYTTEGPERAWEAASVDVPGFVGKTVQTWIGFISDSGKDVATSVYTGEVIVV
jgi:hypothetical protein